MFAIKEATEKDAGGAAEKGKGKQIVSLVDPKRGQNINILLSSKLGKVTLVEIKKAVLTLDENVLLPEVRCLMNGPDALLHRWLVR